jgi:uracil phosphoribosyltransferase
MNSDTTTAAQHDFASVTVIDHPLVQHKLSLLRDRTTSTANFRRLVKEIALLLGYEVTRDLPLMTRAIETPICPLDAPFIEGKKLCIVPVLRAGLGLAEGLLDLIPQARVGHIGIYRDPVTLDAIEYYLKLPTDAAERLVIVTDPMLATGHSLVSAVDRIKALGVTRLKVVCLLAAPEGIRTFGARHPDIPIITAAIDERLNDHGYIVPGLGDAGDRLFGTR